MTGAAATRSDPDFLTAAGGAVYFSADDGVNGRELWSSDGTAAGTVMEPMAAAGASSDPTGLTSSGGRLFFAANGNGLQGEAYNHELWALDLVLDSDGDGYLDSNDCAPADGGLWSVPGEVGNLALSKSGTTAILDWQAPANPGSLAPAYDVVRADQAGGFAAPEAVCVESNDAADTTAQDPAIPTSAWYYLVSAENGCGRGTAGFDSTGLERAIRNCP